MKRIFLASSMAFYRELVEVEKQLQERGWEVKIPISAQTMKKSNDFEVAHFKGVFTYEQKGEFMLTNFDNIAACDALLVINNEKNGIQGYIGANVLMEIGLAAHFKRTIYIWNAIEEQAPYKEELLSFGVKFINKDLSKIVS